MDNIKGMAWMTLAMLGFAVTDMTLVFVTRELPLGQVMFLFGAGGAILFGLWARLQGHRWWTRTLLSWPVMLRNGAEAVATGAFLLALSLIPLSTLSAVIQANPLLVTLGAALFLGERVGWRRWSAIAIGLFGVLVILRPGTAGFDASILLAVLAAIGLSLRDLATRPVPKSVPTTLLASYSFAAVCIAGGLIALVTGDIAPLTPRTGALAASAVATGMVAYFAITAAMRVGEIAVVTPFRYTRLVFAFVIAVVVFDEALDAWTLIGVSIVIVTGLYTFWREGARRAA